MVTAPDPAPVPGTTGAGTASAVTGTGRDRSVVALARRAGWNLADQVVSSGTNAVLSFLVARSVDGATFGGFAVAFTVFTLLVGVSRALATSALAIRCSDAAHEQFQVSAAAAVGTALGLGVLSGAVCLVVGSLLEGPGAAALRALGLVLPGLLVQDAWRMVFFARGRGAAATANDAVWATVQLAALAALLLADAAGVTLLVLAWGGAAAVAAFVGVRQAQVRPRPGAAVDWLRRHRDLSGYLVLEFGVLQGAQQGALLVIAAVAPLSVIGALRGVQVVLGPTTILAVSVFTFAVPELARRRGTLTARQWRRTGLGLSCAVAVLGSCWGAVFVLLPDAAGRALLGDTWPGVDQVLGASIVMQAGAALSLGPSVLLYAMDRAPVTFRIHAALAPLLGIGSIGGVLLAGAEGAAWGMAVAFWAVLPSWWLRLHREVAVLSRAPVASPQPSGP